MSRVKVTMTILCDSEATANRVISEFLPNAGDMAGTAGIEAVSTAWEAESVPHS